MGCDVHPVIQIRPAEDVGWWYSHIVPDRDRSYVFFGTLAGVRDDTYDPIVEPRGWPHGFDPSTEGVRMYAEDHTPSWFALREAKEYRTKLATLVSDEDREWLLARWDDWIADMEYAKKYRWDNPGTLTDDDVRVVFNFDN